MPKTHFVIVFPLYPGVTALDFVGPYEVFSRLPDVQLILASHGGGSVETSSGLIVSGVSSMADVRRCDMICVPGGPGADAALGDDPFCSDVRRLAAGARYVTSVCTGSLILGAVGLLEGKRATSHWNSIDLLPLFGAIPVRERVVRDGNLFTGGGVTAGLDFGLTVAAEIASPEMAKAVQLAIEYAPAPPFQSGTPDQADPTVMAKVQDLMVTGLRHRREAVETAAARLKEAVDAIAAAPPRG